jgi:flagella basal body P-ring formation protein FlgA
MRTRQGLFLIFALLSFVSQVDHAVARQDPGPVRKAVENFLRAQIKGLPGQASFTIGTIDEHNQLPPCTGFDVAMAPGARPWGRTQVAVRCTTEAAWKIFVPVHVKVSGDYLVSAHPLAQGQLLSEPDFVRQTGELTELPNGILTEPSQAIGRTLSSSLPAGRPLRLDMLRQVTVVQQNQSVKIVSQGQGFAVSTDGRALSNAVEGQVVQVRLANGQVVSGVARAGGSVEVRF